MNSVRTVLEIAYGGEVRDLKITFDLMDKVRMQVPWEQIAVDFDKADMTPNFTLMAKFLFHNLKAAGFKPNIDYIYDNLVGEDENLVGLVAQLIMAYMPRGSKKKTVEQAEPVQTKKAKSKQTE